MEKLFCLQFFAEGSAEGGAPAANNSGLTGDFKADFATHVLKNPAGTAAVSRRANQTEDPAPVQEKTEPQAPAAGEQPKAEEQPKDFDKEFDELIKGDYKTAFQKKTQAIINERFKQNKQAETVQSEYEDMLSPLYDKYGVKKGDRTALKAAIEADDSYLAEEAARRHVTKEQVRVERQLAKVTQQQQADRLRQQQQEANTRKWNAWQSEAAEVAKTYPGFDLQSEILNNEQFAQMLDKGLSVKQAYESVHFDEIMQKLTQTAVQDAAARTARSIAANGNRAVEGALGAQPGVATKQSVQDLTGRQIEDILKRVGRGEKITF
ncbi:MAG: hypothetical protein E7523_08335 [Ruminococcaceae bacterium]|nr:hypothetical protein [Oscillospiraceae bacterium]